MNEKKLEQLLAAARQEPAPAPAGDFAAGVLRAARLEPHRRPAEPPSIFDSLNALFPRTALAATVVIIVCLAMDWSLGAAGVPEVSEGAAQAASQFLFDVEDL